MLEATKPNATEPQPARVLIVDDDPSVLSVIAQLLETHDIRSESYSSPRDLLLSIRPDDVGCVITDLEMPQMNGQEVQARLIEAESALSVIMVTAHADVPRTIQIMSRGAVTLLEKPFKSHQLVAAVEKAMELSRKKYQQQSKLRDAETRIAKLSTEEIEVMKLAAAGLPNKAISSQLKLSPRTVDRRRQSALAKLDIASVADFAVLYALVQRELS